MKYQKKPIVIEAFKFGADPMPDWFAAAIEDGKAVLHIVSSGSMYDGSVVIETLEGWMCAEYGDYIILGVEGEIYPCKPDVFRATYEPVRGDAT